MFLGQAFQKLNFQQLRAENAERRGKEANLAPIPEPKVCAGYLDIVTSLYFQVNPVRKKMVVVAVIAGLFGVLIGAAVYHVTMGKLFLFAIFV